MILSIYICVGCVVNFQIISDGNDVVFGHGNYKRNSESIPNSHILFLEVKVCQMSDFCVGFGRVESDEDGH